MAYESVHENEQEKGLSLEELVGCVEVSEVLSGLSSPPDCSLIRCPTIEMYAARSADRHGVHSR